jgi:hypothetical protein
VDTNPRALLGTFGEYLFEAALRLARELRELTRDALMQSDSVSV